MANWKFIEEARKNGYSDDEIKDYLSKEIEKDFAPQPYEESMGRSLMRSVGQGGSLGFQDEAAGVVAGLKAKVKGQDFMPAYEEMQQQEQGQARQFSNEHPYIDFGTQLASGAIAPGLGMMKSGAMAAHPAIKAAVTGATTGAVAGAGYSNPGQRAEGAKTGATIGAVAGPVLYGAGKGIENVGKVVGNEISRYTHKGRTKDIENTYRVLAGNDKARLADTLKGAEKGQTSGQAIAAANRQSVDVFGSSMVRLEKDLSKKAAITDDLQTVYKGQAKGQEKALANIAGTEDDMSRALTERASKTDPLYKAVELSTKHVKTDSVLTKIDDILKKNPNQSDITSPLNALKEKLTSSDKAPQNLYSLSKEIKIMMNRVTPGGNKEYNVSALSEIKSLLDKEIGKAEVNFRLAQTLYKQKSKPINQMEVGRILQNAHINASGKETPQAFLKAVQEAPKTIKKATGFPRFDKLDDVLSKPQVDSINKISKELLIDQQAMRMANKVDNILSSMETASKPRIPNALTREITITNHLLKRLADKDFGGDYEKLMLNLHKNPEALANVLSKADNYAQRGIMLGVIRNAGIAMTAKQLAEYQDNER